MTMLRRGLLLILVLALCVKRGESSSRPEKGRQKLKAVLFEYKTKGEGGREPSRTSWGRSGVRPPGQVGRGLGSQGPPRTSWGGLGGRDLPR